MDRIWLLDYVVVTVVKNNSTACNWGESQTTCVKPVRGCTKRRKEEHRDSVEYALYASEAR